eukprot:2142578-Rhodomonas_salina.1
MGSTIRYLITAHCSVLVAYYAGAVPHVMQQRIGRQRVSVVSQSASLRSISHLSRVRMPSVLGSYLVCIRPVWALYALYALHMRIQPQRIWYLRRLAVRENAACSHVTVSATTVNGSAASINGSIASIQGSIVSINGSIVS